jgi:hypothetical protein
VNEPYGPVAPFHVDMYRRARGVRKWCAQSALVNGPAVHSDFLQACAAALLLVPIGGAARVIDAAGVTCFLTGSAPGREFSSGFVLPRLDGFVPAAPGRGPSIEAAALWAGQGAVCQQCGLIWDAELLRCHQYVGPDGQLLICGSIT